MIRRLIAISTVMLLVSTSGIAALAQGMMSSSSRGGMGGGSAFSGGGMGGGMSGMSGMGGGMGNSGFGGGMGSGLGGMGGGMGNSGFGGTSGGMGNNSIFGNSGSGTNGQQNFIGRDAGDMQAAFGQMTKASTQYMKNMNRSMSANRKSAKKATQTAGQPMRVEVKVAFNPPRLSSAQMALDVRTRLTKLLVSNHMSQPTLIMEGDTVVLRGAAASENERDVISQLLAMEPGIRNVRNEMIVAQPAGAANGTAPAPGS